MNPAIDWMTLRECADDFGVTPEVIRQVCVRWREGKPGGLPYAHAGAKPEGETDRVNYRVRRDDWEAFKRERRREEAKENRQERKWVEHPISYV